MGAASKLDGPLVENETDFSFIGIQQKISALQITLRPQDALAAGNAARARAHRLENEASVDRAEKSVKL